MLYYPTSPKTNTKTLTSSSSSSPSPTSSSINLNHHQHQHQHPHHHHHHHQKQNQFIHQHPHQLHDTFSRDLAHYSLAHTPNITALAPFGSPPLFSSAPTPILSNRSSLNLKNLSTPPLWPLTPGPSTSTASTPSTTHQAYSPLHTPIFSNTPLNTSATSSTTTSTTTTTTSTTTLPTPSQSICSTQALKLTSQPFYTSAQTVFDPHQFNSSHLLSPEPTHFGGSNAGPTTKTFTLSQPQQAQTQARPTFRLDRGLSSSEIEDGHSQRFLLRRSSLSTVSPARTQNRPRTNSRAESPSGRAQTSQSPSRLGIALSHDHHQQQHHHHQALAIEIGQRQQYPGFGNGPGPDHEQKRLEEDKVRKLPSAGMIPTTLATTAQDSSGLDPQTQRRRLGYFDLHPMGSMAVSQPFFELNLRVEAFKAALIEGTTVAESKEELVRTLDQLIADGLGGSVRLAPLSASSGYPPPYLSTPVTTTTVPTTTTATATAPALPPIGRVEKKRAGEPIEPVEPKAARSAEPTGVVSSGAGAASRRASLIALSNLATPTELALTSVELGSAQSSQPALFPPPSQPPPTPFVYGQPTDLSPVDVPSTFPSFSPPLLDQKPAFASPPPLPPPLPPPPPPPPSSETPTAMEMDQLMAAQANLELDLAQLSNMISSLPPPPPPPPSAPENNSDGLLPVEEEEEEEAETSTSWNGNEEQINQLQAQIIQRVPSPPVNKQMGAASAGVSDELAAAFEPIFTSWLGRLCSDLDMKDSKGEPIHQTLMARKMQRLEESADFRPFKFRIQAFTNAFFEELVRCGFSEKDLPMKKVRQYLWSQTCISRFNEEGKKAKSKGNHVWHIEAQKIVNGQWNFLHFQRKIVGTPSNIGYIGKKWIWQPKVWDPQCSAHNIRAHFSTKGNGMPNWLSWKDNVLSGIPTFEDLGQQYEFLVVATTNHNSRRYTLEYPVKLEVRSADELDLANSGPSTSSTTTASGSTFEQQQQIPSGNAFEQSTGSFETNTGVFEQVPRGAFEPPPPGAFEQPQPGGFEQSNSTFEQSSTTFESTSTTFKQAPPPVTFEQVTTGVVQFDQTPTSTTTTTTTTSTTTDQLLKTSPSSLYNNFNSSSSHEVRLATVRDDLLKGDPDTYVSAGRIVREAIVSEDPLERQFAAEVLKQAGSTGFGQEGLG